MRRLLPHPLSLAPALLPDVLRRCGMKSLFAALLGAALLAAPVSEVLAQGTSSSSSSTSSAPAPADKPSAPAPAASGTVTTPGGSASGSVTTDRSSNSSSVKTEERRDDGASALPRSTVVERTTIFGLSPTAAVLIAAALLLVVILAIVAMTRSNDNYIDQRRL